MINEENIVDYLGGTHSVQKMLEVYPSYVKVLYIGVRSQQMQSLVDFAIQQGVRVEFCDKEQLNLWLPNVNHQGAVISYDRLPKLDLHQLIKQSLTGDQKPLILILDKIQDPQNLGACLRSAAAFGVDGVIIPKDKAVGVTASVVKVSVGAAATVPVVTVTNITRAMGVLKQEGFWIYGTSERAGKTINEADVSVPTAWVMGNEMKGLSANVEKHCDALYRIETSGFSTLNIATSASICLYQTFSARGGVRH